VQRATSGEAGPSSALTWQSIEGYFPHSRPGNHILTVPEYSLVYVKNPKVASSTVVVWLDRLHTGDLDFDLQKVHTEHRLPPLAEVGRPRVLELLGGAGYRFSFVRHPVRRFESVYWDKMVRHRRFRLQVAGGLGMSGETPPTFEEFLGAVEQQDPVGGMDPHWRPQHVNLLHPLVAYDHVGKLETFASDLERIREEARLPDIPVVSRNVSPRQRPESVYDGRPDLVQRVEKLYAEDFELYGY
jgi:hypothetical protein